MLGGISAIVLFVQDLQKCVAFYRDLLGFQYTFNDDVSYGFKLGDQDFLLLEVPAAAEMVGDEALSPGNPSGHHMLLCVGVESVDATYEALMAKGLVFVKPPKDQAWGRRTAYFADPEGNLWELWHSLPS